MKRSIRRRLGSGLGLGIAATLAAAPPAVAAFDSPQVAALERLRAESTIPVEVHFRGGFPVRVSAQVQRPAPEGPVGAAAAYLEEFAELYGIAGDGVELSHVRTDSGPLAGQQIVRFMQSLRGFPVLDAQVQVRVEPLGGSVRILGSEGALLQPEANDTLPPTPLSIDLEPAITQALAEAAARGAVGLPGAEISGASRLMIHDPRLTSGAGEPRLVWRVTLLVAGSRQLRIDAITGAIVLDSRLESSDDDLEDWDLQLDDARFNNAGLSCFWFSETQSIGDEDGIDPDYLEEYPYREDRVRLIWWAARDTHEMLHELWDRHSYDDDDAQLEVFMFANVRNASAAEGCGIQVSLGWESRDVLAHEYGHLMIDETSDLAGYNEPGALNESFGDILGMLLDPEDWLLGEDAELVPSNPGFVRNFFDPTARSCAGGDSGVPQQPCPDRYSQRIVSSPIEAQDYGGVHWNAGILNKAHYLLMAGGEFNGRLVLPIGRAKAGWLAYTVLTNLASNAWFIDARNVAVATARSFADQGLHGFIAADVCSVRNAFRAVEIGEGDGDCDGVEDNVDDEDGDGILDDGDSSGSHDDAPCISNWIWGCDDNCTDVPNPTQRDSDGDGDGDACDADDDNDGVPDWMDFCPFVAGLPIDSDGDGLRDCLDEDDDNDGILDDGDGSGDPHDHPCPSGVTTHCDDNCQADPNADQFDGNGNGNGDACDPDADGDGLYVLDDNCTFTYNPDQADADGDGLGDVCDKCPGTADNLQAWHPGYPQLGIDPFPIQPDSDGDGLPDACDARGWDATSVSIADLPYSAFNSMRVDGQWRTIAIHGPPGAGNHVRLELPACAAPGPLGASERVELVLGGMPDTLDGWVEDDSGRLVARVRTSNAAPGMRGLRLRPRCDRDYSLTLRSRPEFGGDAAFGARAEVVVPPPGENPWTSDAGRFDNPPPRPPDQDGDGQWDGVDECPMDYDPEGYDRDLDGRGDVCDNCRTAFNPEQAAVEFDPLRAVDRNTLGWGESRDYEFVSGRLGAFTVELERGQGSGERFALDSETDPEPGAGRWYLFRHYGGCGTFGTAERDAAFPASCGNTELDCPEGTWCDSGSCRGDAQLTVTKAGPGSGGVTSSPAGIDCGATCSAAYPVGSVVTLTAQPVAGHSAFAGWSGACTGSGGCVVTMDAAKSVTATFTLLQFTLSVAKAGTGTGSVSSSPAGISCGASCSAPYSLGTVVTLTAQPTDSTHVFAGWSGACTGTGNCSVTMAGDRDVTATFHRLTHVLSVTKAGTGTGSVTSNPPGISCGATCSAPYVHGTQVTLTAQPTDSTHVFAGWSGACSGTGPCTVTLTAPRSVTATFQRVTYTLSVSLAGTGVGAVSSSPAGISCGADCSESYAAGTVVTLTATVSGRTAFVGWSGACSGTGTCIVTLSGNRAVTATFRAL